MRKIHLSFLCLLIFMSVSCSTGANSVASVSISQANGKEFILSNMYEGMKINITFEKNMVYGFSGVNRYSGVYLIKDGKITFGEMISTMMAGPEDAMNAERNFLILLNTGGIFSFDGSVLKIGDLVFKIKN